MTYEELLAEIASHLPRWEAEAADLPGTDGKMLRKTLERFAEDILDPC